jgi:exonuclease-1
MLTDGFTVGQWPVPWNWPWGNPQESQCNQYHYDALVLIRPRFVDFAMHRVRMLQHFGIIPYIIFDGDYLPSKAATEASREKRRLDSKKLGMELLNAGKTSQAYLEFQKAVDVTPEMARQFIDELKKVGVQYIVAPYEADAQMVYLERKGIIDGILSEDSDLLVFGAKCLLTKLDQYGNCIEVNKADFCACKDVTLTGWSDTEFRTMAILSGCDYLASITNMGLKTAYRMVRKHKTIEKVIRMLQFDGKFHVPKDYIESFRQAEFTFLHQRVFCPISRRIVLHTEPFEPLDVANMAYIGLYVEPEIAEGVARGDLNPMTKMPIITATRSHTSSLATPWSSSKARKQAPQPPSDDPKKGVSIETFFKKRMPLAELPINLFTHSPSQQETLQRNSGANWQASSARPFIARSASQPIQTPLSAPAPIRTVTRTHIRSPTVSESRPPKRARLWEDDELPASNSKVELGRSRFFGSAASEPSPTVGKNNRRRGKKDDITIFSDDSVEEALLSLPDFDGFSNNGLKAGNKIAIFEEVEGPETSVPSDSPDLTPASDFTTSQETGPDMTQSMSATSSFDQPATPSEFVSVPCTIDQLNARFSVGSSTPTPQSTVNVKVSKAFLTAIHPPTPGTSPRRSRIPLAVKKINTPVIQSNQFKARQTPLQRLGASAANRSKLPMTPPLTPVYTSAKNVSRRSLLSIQNLPFPEVSREKNAVEYLEPALIPLPDPDDTETAALEQNGSEDLIIHDSEEDEMLSPEPEARIDFRRFAYANS